MIFDFTLEDVEELDRLADMIELTVTAGLGRTSEAKTAQLVRNVAEWRRRQLGCGRELDTVQLENTV